MEKKWRNTKLKNLNLNLNRQSILSGNITPKIIKGSWQGMSKCNFWKFWLMRQIGSAGYGASRGLWLTPSSNRQEVAYKLFSTPIHLWRPIPNIILINNPWHLFISFVVRITLLLSFIEMITFRTVIERAENEWFGQRLVNSALHSLVLVYCFWQHGVEWGTCCGDESAVRKRSVSFSWRLWDSSEIF